MSEIIIQKDITPAAPEVHTFSQLDVASRWQSSLLLLAASLLLAANQRPSQKTTFSPQ